MATKICSYGSPQLVLSLNIDLGLWGGRDNKVRLVYTNTLITSYNYLIIT